MVAILSSLRHRYRKFLLKHDKTHREAREAQRRALRREVSDPSGVRQLIIFLAPGYDKVNGGIMSIVSLFTETLRLQPNHQARCVICTLPNEPPLLRYTRFENSATLLDFLDVLAYFSEVSDVLIHVPEFAIRSFVSNLDSKSLGKLKRLNTTFNVLLQNVGLIRFEDIALLRQYGNVTCTTAHRAYSGPDFEQRLGCPVHLLSVFISPEKYVRAEYGRKQNLLVISPDEHPSRNAILNRLQRELPALETRVIKGIPYAEYLDIIKRAKWALTFGEGLDGYFIETIFSGGISFAVYNDYFFTEDFRGLQTVYLTYDELAEQLIADMRRLDNERDYAEYQERQFEICSSHYCHARYIENLSSFYRKYWPCMKIDTVSPRPSIA
jgi:hypothetical protein